MLYAPKLAMRAITPMMKAPTKLGMGSPSVTSRWTAIVIARAQRNMDPANAAIISAISIVPITIFASFHLVFDHDEYIIS